MTIDSVNHGLVQNTTNFRASSTKLHTPITFSNLAINKIILVFCFNFKGLLRLINGVICKDSVDLGPSITYMYAFTTSAEKTMFVNLYLSIKGQLFILPFIAEGLRKNKFPSN